MNAIRSFFLLIVCLLSLAGCRKLIEIDLPSDQLTTDLVFETDASATAALRGLYAQLSTGTGEYMINGGITITGALSADELLTVNSNTDYDPFMNNNLQANSYVISSYIWATAYKGIYQANDLMEKTAASKQLSVSKKREITGEALFIRSFYLFYLTGLFDSIPLPLTTDYRINAVLPRTSRQAVFAQLSEDLETAEGLLETAYPTKDRVRANKWAVTAFRARLHLYRNEWKEAITQSTNVISSGQYHLDSLNGICRTASPEAIFQLRAVGTINNNPGIGAVFVPAGTAVPKFKVNPLLLSSFEAGDQRLEKWFASFTLNNSTYIIPFKYKLRSASSSGPEEFNTVLRLAEQYLVRAEAYARSGQPGKAVDDLNEIRSRADLPLLDENDLSPEMLLDAIAKERQAELCIEFGHRWLDLKRNGKIDAVMNNAKPGLWQPEHALFPIPQNERLKNTALSQNPGYDD